MRIAYISGDHGIPVFGNKGAAIHVRELSGALQAAGHAVEIVACRTGGDRPAGFSVPVQELPLARPERSLMTALGEDPDASEPASKEIRAMLSAATFRYRALPILRAFRPDVIYERYSLMGTAGGDLAREIGMPHLLEVNAPLSEEHARHRGIAWPRTVQATERRVLAGADAIVAVSEPLKTWIVRHGVPRERVTVLANGVDVDRFDQGPGDVRARYGLGDGPVVGFVGTLKGWHGTATLIRAFAIVARQAAAAGSTLPRLLLVGDGPQRGPLESLAGDEGVRELVTFTGMIDHGEMPAHVAAMDIAVAPYDETPDFYFSPLKLFEYMASGRAIVAARIGQIEDCVRDGDNGLLYPPGDTDALAACLGKLIEEPDLAASLGRAARADARANRSWAGVAARVVELAESAMTAFPSRQLAGHAVGAGR